MPTLGGSEPVKRTCFVVAEYGADAEGVKRSAQVLKHIVRAALLEDFEVVRADELADEGQISDQIVRHLVEDDLVVADLSRPNPNVYYEVGVRHSAGKPIIHLMETGQRLPFDIQGQRAIPYDITDLDSVEEARKDVRRAVEAIERADWQAGGNPVTSALRISRLTGSPDSEEKLQGAVLAQLASLADEVRSLGARLPADPYGKLRSPAPTQPRRAISTPDHLLPEAIAQYVGDEGTNGDQPLSTDDVAIAYGIANAHAEQILLELAAEGRVARSGTSSRQGWGAVPAS